jgi:hypothetical protein
MQKIEIQAHSLEEAKLIAFQAGITVVQDATKNWKKAGSPILTKDLNIYAADFLEEKGMFDFKGAGIIITVTSGVEDTRKNPFKINSVRRKGRCKLKRVIEIRTQKDNQLLGTASNKTEAIELSKELIKKCQENIYGKTVYYSSDIDFEMEYTPSVRTQLGQYIVFGVDEADVRISKRKNREFE